MNDRDLLGVLRTTLGSRVTQNINVGGYDPALRYDLQRWLRLEFTKKLRSLATSYAPDWAPDEDVTFAVVEPENVNLRHHVPFMNQYLRDEARAIIDRDMRTCSMRGDAVLILCPIQ